MPWPPENLSCYAWLPEPGTAAEWTEGGFGSSVSHGEIKQPPNMKTPLGGLYYGQGTLCIRGKRVYCMV